MHPNEIRISDFTYELPVDRIAQQPLADRSGSRLLVYREGRITDAQFRSLTEHIPKGSLLVLNDTRVVKAPISFTRATGAVIECMVLEPEEGRTIEKALLDQGTTRWWCMVGNAKRWKAGEVLSGAGYGELRVVRLAQRDGEYLLEFNWNTSVPFVQLLALRGLLPLPPYMKRLAVAEDDIRYNTVFAVNDGSVAAPTASLHFTPALLKELEGNGVRRANVTLHVGAGTFLPVKSERMMDHAMHTEQLRVPRSTVEMLLASAMSGSPIIPVGTTALRTIESLCWFGDDLLAGQTMKFLSVGQWRPYEQPAESSTASLSAVLDQMDRERVDHVQGSTSLLIAPGYPFRLATGLITNFHQPGSTLLLLVAAFLDPNWRSVYDHALSHGYRFLSYGDSSLLMR